MIAHGATGPYMRSKPIQISLFGACIVRSADPSGFQISGAKHRALFALLATAAFGRRTRSYLQETLWGTACYDSGRQSLRRALADIKQIMGPTFAEVLTCTNSDVTLDLDKVEFIGKAGGGTFLEGLTLAEERFSAWLAASRSQPEQYYSLYCAPSQILARPMLPTVAALPFRQAFGSDDHAVLGDWLAEEVCRSLSRSSLISVISHLSCRRLSESGVDVPAIRNVLKADYCVTGSLRPRGNDLVLDADFIDTASGRILWTRRFDGPLQRFLDSSGDGVASIVQSVGQSIADDAITHVASRSLQDLEDHRLLVAAVGLMHSQTLSDFSTSRALIEEVLRRAPRTAEAHAWFGKWLILNVFNGWSSDTTKDTRRAIDCTARALDLNPDSAFCLTIDGFAHNNLLKRMDVASARYAEALRRNPNEALSWLLKGALHAFEDESRQAVDAVQRASELSPIDPFGYFYQSLTATAYLSDGDYERALAYAESSLAINARHLSTLRAKITALHHLGRHDDARTAAAELRRRHPDSTVAGYLKGHPAADFKLGRTVAAALSAAGIP